MKFNTLGGKLVKGVKKNCRPFATYGLDLKITEICTVIIDLFFKNKFFFKDNYSCKIYSFVLIKQMLFDIYKLYIFIHFLVLPPHGYD